MRGRPEWFLAISDTAERRAESETLIADIASELSLKGEFVARLDLQPTQGIVDFHRAARNAGRRLGLHIDVTSEIVKGAGQIRMSVKVVAPVE